MKVALASDAPGGWLLFVVAADEGTVYEHQTRGLLTELRLIKGAGIPCNGEAESSALQQFCERHGLSYGLTGAELSHDVLDELAGLVAAVTPAGFVSVNDDYDDRLELALDRTNPAQIVEAWMPVAYGPHVGVLLFPNSD